MPFPVTAFMSPGGNEFLLILLALILLFGAKDAPRILRSIYSAMNKLQRAAASFRYKIMYGDLHSAADDPYDVDEGTSEETEASGFRCEMEDGSQRSEVGGQESEGGEPETRNPNLESRIPKPESRTPNLESRISNPESRPPDPDR